MNTMKRTIYSPLIENLKGLAVIIAALLLNYFGGHVTLALLSQAGLAEVPASEVDTFAIKMALGLPWLLAEIAVMKYATKLLLNNVFNS